MRLNLKFISILTSAVIAGGAITILTNRTLANEGTATYSNVFISYVSPNDVQATANFANEASHTLGGYIIWPLQGDTDPVNDQGSSLFYALHAKANPNQVIMGYWENWGVYPSGRALPTTAYPIPGSVDQTGAIQTNDDFVHKLSYLNTVAYAFLEAQANTYLDTNTGITYPNKTPENIGTIYFNDPWADLVADDKFCSSNPICTYTASEKGADFAASAKMGNFEAFADLPKTYAGLKTVITVGGFAHDDSFEAILDEKDDQQRQKYMQNFATSANKILTNYKVSGIDLDYENPNMHHEQSKKFAELVQVLSNTLAADPSKSITITILADPAYLDGTKLVPENPQDPNSPKIPGGFDNGVLAELAALKNVKLINLMTYDFHGAFDYNPDGSGKTGFLSNLEMPNNAPEGYNPQFSIKSSTKKLIDLGVPAGKIGIGIPTYGRALANIDQGKNAGLFSSLTTSASIPAGDLDPQGCNSSIPLGPNACSGTFSYSYIVNNMLKNGFTATDWQNNDKGVYNGSTAYATTFTPGASTSNYSLEITNTGTTADGNSAFTVTIATPDGSNSFASDSLSPTPTQAPFISDKTYDTTTNPSSTAIEDKKGLIVQVSTYAGVTACPTPFDFTQSMHVMVKAVGKNIVCDIQPLS